MIAMVLLCGYVYRDHSVADSRRLEEIKPRDSQISAPGAQQSVARPDPSSSTGSLAGVPHKTATYELPAGSVSSYLPSLLQRASGPRPSSEAALLAAYALNACRMRLKDPSTASGSG